MHVFAFTSRGDPVQGRLWVPPGAGPHPLVWVVAGVGEASGQATAPALCERLASAGMIAAHFDLPLQGARASRKLSDRLVRAVRSEAPTPTEARLSEAFRTQVGAELGTATALLAARTDVDAERLACLALEPGAEAVAAWAEQAGGVHLVRGKASAADAAIAELVAALVR